MTQTDACACRPIISDPARAHATHPRRPLQLQEAETRHLLAYLATIPDPRTARGRRHPLVAILAMAAAAVLAGARSVTAIAEWAADAPQPVRAALSARRDAPNHFTVPAEATIRRTLALLDADTLAAAIGAWLAGRDPDRDCAATSRRRAVAIDGKTLRGARAPAGDGRPVHLLAAMDHATRAVLAQQQVGGAPEEVPAFALLLERLELGGVVVTADALQTHPAAAEFLVTHKQAHYLFAVKANQPTLVGPLCRPALAPHPRAGPHPRPGTRPHRGPRPQGRHRPPLRLPPRRPGPPGHPQDPRPAGRRLAPAVADRSGLCGD
jgi:DDE_Tnp_1-associated/Transposase DDE domain